MNSFKTNFGWKLVAATALACTFAPSFAADNIKNRAAPTAIDRHDIETKRSIAVEQTAPAANVANVATTVSSVINKRELKLQVRSSINAGRPNDALQALDAELAQSKGEDAADLHLLQGIAWQQMAKSSADEKTRREAKQHAELAYTNALQANSAKISVDGKASTSGAVLNNLASLYAQSGEDDKARRAFEQAIVSNDPRRGYYALNYAKYLEQRDPAKAIPIARQALAAAPTSTAAQDLVSNLLWRHDAGAMLPFAIEQSDQGFTDLATQAAIKCLKSGSRPADEKRAWLILLAKNIAASYAYAVASVDALRTELASLGSDADIGRGSQQLRAALQSPPSDRAALDWWNQQTAVLPAQKTSGRAAMRNLLRGIADANFTNDSKRAENYLLAALMLEDNHGPDADTFLRLVELYANDPVKLQALMNRYQYAMFTEKSDAYARGDWPLIFRLHLALGMTYAHLGIWKSSSEYQNGIFQLEAAQRAADRLNRTAQAQNKMERVALPPIAIAKLAAGYVAIGRKDLSLAASIDGASNLQKLGRVNDSEDVLDSIAADQIQTASPEVKNKIDRLRTAVRQAK